MTRDAEEGLLRIRLPVSETYWQDYGVPVALLVGALLALALVLADSLGEAVTVAAAFLGLSLGAILAGLAVYNVVVVALLAAKR